MIKLQFRGKVSSNLAHKGTKKEISNTQRNHHSLSSKGGKDHMKSIEQC